MTTPHYYLGRFYRALEGYRHNWFMGRAMTNLEALVYRAGYKAGWKAHSDYNNKKKKKEAEE